VSQAQGRIAGDGPTAIQDLGDAVRGHLKLASQGGCAHFERFQFLGEMFAGMDRLDGDSGSPSTFAQ
jgi:hypothetical protein